MAKGEWRRKLGKGKALELFLFSLTIYSMVSELDKMAQSLADAAKPERILLFGSHANGTADPTSDYDFALIFGTSGELRTGLRRANRALWPRSHPVDLIGLTRDSIDNGRTALAREILKTGRVVYTKQSHNE